MQNKDGGWGLHIEGPSTMFGTVLSYVTLRLLGEGGFGVEGAMEKGRKWILDRGGATAITSWGKMWLSVWTQKLLAWAKILIVLQLWVDIWYASDGHRYLEHMNGLEIIHSHQKCGYVLTFFQFIQVSLSLSLTLCV